MTRARGSALRRLATTAAVVASGGVLAGAVVAAQRAGDPAADADALQAAIDATPMTRVAELSAGNGLAARGVYVQELPTGHLCVWDAPSATSRLRQGGCNPIDDPLGGRKVSATLAYDGGPAVESVSDARLAGLAVKSAAQVVLVMSDGSERALRTRPAGLSRGSLVAFAYRVRAADLRRGVGPVAVVVRDADGTEIDRQVTGIG